MVGHIGDGNFHTMPMVDMTNPKEIAAAEILIDKMAKRAIAMDGTCSGEHGIGQGKMKFLKAEHGPALATMRAIKQALDPQDILNPGKILPAP
jgi:D-lactate dehydrogenase (cytochrome)